MSSHVIVLDANILIRAVLGNKVRNLLLDFHEIVDFLVPDICLKDAEKYLPIIFEKRSIPPELGMQVLSDLQCIIKIIDESIYQQYAMEAKLRIRNRDVNDWPIIATAMTFACPIWTEDQDFFGSGISIWTTDRVHIFLASS